jgi:hypothetical protein
MLFFCQSWFQQPASKIDEQIPVEARDFAEASNYGVAAIYMDSIELLILTRGLAG